MTLPTIIPVQNFEIIRDQIALILRTEFDVQLAQFYNTKCARIRLFTDRLVPLDKEEGAAIIISTFKGTYDQLTAVGIQDGPIEYLIRIMANSPTIGVERGDKLSGRRLQELIGIVRYILMHPNYVNLGLNPGIIQHVPEITSFGIHTNDIGPNENEFDAIGTASAHLIFRVWIGENAEVSTYPLLTTNDSVVRIELTDQGYEYKFTTA